MYLSLEIVLPLKIYNKRLEIYFNKRLSQEIYYFRNSFASREISQEIRDEIDTLINEAAKDMLNHWTNTNRSLQVCVLYFL